MENLNNTDKTSDNAEKELRISDVSFSIKTWDDVLQAYAGTEPVTLEIINFVGFIKGFCKPPETKRKF